MSDPIYQLPTDDSVITPVEQQLLDTVFTQEESIKKLGIELTKPLILASLFVVLSLKITDNLISKILPQFSKSPYTVILIKAVMFLFILLAIQNSHLVRR